MEISAKVISLKAQGFVKCPRCMKYGPNSNIFDNLCPRCEEILLIHFPNDPSVALIKAHNKEFIKRLNHLELIRESAKWSEEG